MKIALERRKGTKGKDTLRLVYYFGSSVDPETGKIKHDRKREQLDLFLFTTPKTPTEKQHNKEALQLAENIKAKRLTEIASGKHGFINNTKNSANFLKFFDELADSKKQNNSSGNYAVWISCRKHLADFAGSEVVSFEAVTPQFVSNFKDYLQAKAKTKSGNPLSANTRSVYFNKLRATINRAIDLDHLNVDPIKNIKGFKPENNKREYLTIDELKKLAQTECRYDILKRAFLFSCLTGLRWSDVNNLTWNDVEEANGSYRIVFVQKKKQNSGNGLLYLDLSAQAYSLMGTKESDRVFKSLKYSAYMNTELLRWCMAAGISKHITFHSGRHTFAVTQLTMGTSIYTLSKLLGHSELKTTQIYADIIDATRKEAMHVMPDIGI
jgi:integrase